MRSFDRWFNEQGRDEIKPKETLKDVLQDICDRAGIDADLSGLDLPDGLFVSGGKIMACCKICDNDYEYDGDPKDGFDQNMSYCGGSPRCCP